MTMEQIEVFQSTPANFTAGDGMRGLLPQHPAPVSIHARQFHSGRPPRHFRIENRSGLFQSTPANFTAGDRTLIPGCGAPD